jgi:AraC-like DNA-binding protein
MEQIGGDRPVDLLAHVLAEAGLVRRLLDMRRLDDARALRFPCDRSMGLHVVTQGQLWLHAPALREPIALATGDMALMARGCIHVISSGADLRGVPVASVTELADTPWDGSTTDPGNQVMSGAYQFWNTPLHPLFTQLPSWFVVRANDIAPLSPLALSVGQMRAELAEPQLGSQNILHALLDIVFAYLMRRMLQQHATEAGIAHTLLDPPVHTAVTLLHDDCAHPWTLDTLASCAGLSRTAFAGRFRDAVGDTPLQYLRTIRMQHAVRLLCDTSHALEQIASAVGYKDAFSFSKVFKRTLGVSPREFRRRDTEERASPHRFAVR